MRLELRNKEGLTAVHKYALKGGSLDVFMHFRSLGFNTNGEFGSEVSELLAATKGKNHPDVLGLQKIGW